MCEQASRSAHARALEVGAHNRSRCIHRARDNKAPGMVRSYEILLPHSISSRNSSYTPRAFEELRTYVLGHRPRHCEDMGANMVGNGHSSTSPSMWGWILTTAALPRTVAPSICLWLMARHFVRSGSCCGVGAPRT